MLDASAERINALPEDALVLDVGGWAIPFPRADWVIDLMPYRSRGLFAEPDPDLERFSADTWVQRDICDREPWPFTERQFDFAICSQTLEDVRDPLWVCSELIRVARAGYIEVPSRLEEQTFGVHGPWVGWSHHRWLIEVRNGSIEFVLKPHLLASRRAFHFPAGFAAGLTAEQRVETLFWEGGFAFGERMFYVPEELDGYLAGIVAEHGPRRGPLARIRRRLGVALSR